MKNLSPTQHACLDAMGIDVWVSRDQAETEIVESAPESVATSAESTAESTAESIVAQNIEAPKTPEVKIPALKTPDATIESEVKIAPEVTKVPVEPAPATLNIPTDWNGLQQAVSTCQSCELHISRTNTVFGAGNQNADWLIIGDTPTFEDDSTGNPFTGQSGDLLTAMLRAIKLTRQQVFITNTLKCTTPNNREPQELEIDNCLQYLSQQINLIKPKLILVMGQSAAQRVLNTHSTLARLRQKTQTIEGKDIPVVVTYHPASLLSMPANKAEAWQDLQFAQKIISTESVL